MTRRGWRACAFLALLGLASSSPADPAAADRLRGAKALFFDGSYAEARRAWEAVRTAGGAEAKDAEFWIARCSENLGEPERALREYQAYLGARPANAALAEEARTARAGLAFKLYKRAGRREHLDLLRAALKDPGRSVRYFAALQLSQLDPRDGAAAIPVLRDLLAREKDPDLVDRAKLGLLRLDPKALAAAPQAVAASAAPRSRSRSISWIKVRIFEKGKATPTVSVNLPVALADLVFKSLPDDARERLRRQGYDADNFWQRLKGLGPAEIVTINGGDGERIQIWTE
jgi:tetratricopeptide (TPR) repeat protein